MPLDTSQIIEIESSPTKLLLLFGLCVLITGLGVAVAVPLIPDFRPGVFQQILCYAGAAFFALCTVIVAWRLATSRGPVVTITSDGIRDIRVAAEFIPWRAVRKIFTWEHAGAKMMILAIDPAVEHQLTLTKMAQWSRAPNRALGADGLYITAQGLKIDHQTLFDMSQDRVRAAQV